MKENRTEFNLWQPVFLRNPIQHYSWGERGPGAFIPRLLGIRSEADTPYAELWIGAHLKAPSRVVLGDKEIPLNEWISEHPEAILGRRVVQKFGPQLPFLLKVLSAAEALSIQVHPNKAQAQRLHAVDPVHYPDANHKPEIAIALDGLKALAGFRNFDEIIKILREFPEVAELAGKQAVSVVRGQETVPDEEKAHWIRTIYLLLMQRSEKNPQKLREALEKLDNCLLGKSNLPIFLRELYPELRDKYGTDVGLLSLFLLRFVDLRPGEGLLTRAGIPHAYLRGNIIECMANSDNVVRAGLTPKFKDLDAMAEIIAQNPQPVPIYHPEPNAEEVVYSAPIREFRVVRIKWTEGKSKSFNTRDSVHIFLVIEGAVEFLWKSSSTENKLMVRRGESLLIPSTLAEFRLLARQKSLAFLVNVPEIN